MNKIIDGKKVSNEIKERLKCKIEKLEIKPSMVAISVGDDPASQIYVNKKKELANFLGIDFNHISYDEDILESDLINKIKELNNDSNIDGIIVQLPLPKKYDTDKIINTIDSNKDIDGLTYINQGKLLDGKEGLISCTPKGIIKLLDYYNISIEGKNVVIVGRSTLVGKPLYSLLLNRNATVTMCHSKTIDLDNFTKNADILIVAAGHKHLINRNMIKEDSIIIDVGINRVDNKLYGDVDYDDVYDKVRLITPVPGGVGPMTVVMLMENVLESYKKTK